MSDNARRVQCTVTGEPPTGELKIKRFYGLDGYTITACCPQCGAEASESVTGDCVNYPDMNTPYAYSLYCEDCGDFDVLIKINLTLEAVTP